ncbi:MAG: hypothetical protein A2Y14_01900 [Verrucomicrobia bacterium GWF2_51_19]|nr:MAG: hypothetical protein A2Y14_01900 [Verrucomicrobia bacterium GWF2_51_19]HCJ11854.1 hypothetical protein [Opitutae bacterium]
MWKGYDPDEEKKALVAKTGNFFPEMLGLPYKTDSNGKSVLQENPRTGQRNLMATRIDQQLFGVLTRTTCGVKDGVCGIVMQIAPGKFIQDLIPQLQTIAPSSKELLPLLQDFISNEDFICSLTELQLTDCITGELDRHIHNYFIDIAIENGKVIFKSIRGIDNDMGFSSKVFPTYTGYVNERNLEDYRYKTPGYPKCVTQEMKDKILALKPESLDTIDNGLLEKEEIDATKERLTLLQEYLNSDSCTVVEKLGSVGSTILKDYNEPDDSYFGDLRENGSYYNSCFEEFSDLFEEILDGEWVDTFRSKNTPEANIITNLFDVINGDLNSVTFNNILMKEVYALKGQSVNAPFIAFLLRQQIDFVPTDVLNTISSITPDDNIDLVQIAEEYEYPEIDLLKQKLGLVN